MAQTITTTNAFVNLSDPQGHLRVVGEVAANDVDQSLTVPAGKVWFVQHLFVILTTTATVGNRRIQVRGFDATPTELSRFQSLNDQIASSTEYYNFGVAGEVSELVPGIHFAPLAPVWLGPGWSLRITTPTVVDANDDLQIQAVVIEYDAGA